jgi:hypothetical protein
VQLFARFSELEGLPSERRKAAYQYAFGQVSGRPTFYLSILAMAITATTANWLGGVAFGGLGGQFGGLVVGVVLGMFLTDWIMRRAMRPHLRRFLEDHGAS